MAANNATAVTAGDNNLETASTAAGATMIALSIIMVACRFYARLLLKSGLKWDDWFILIALTSLIAAGVLVLVVCWPLSGALLSKIRVGTSTLRKWRSYNLTWSSGQKSGGVQSREVEDHAARPHNPGELGIELLAIPNRSISTGSGVTVAHPQPALSLDTDNSDDIIYVMQGGHAVLGHRGLDDRV
ncbi:hypothetical protein VM1G_09646 [Cytospora mali]|uniref:Uncharacterized protein n=1 Tax=Cytospora mali TaxID=578113 RepID=A0A194WCW6_CYTMA|nr:hypothetical protein VM1G_09646 [Valsa mali]